MTFSAITNNMDWSAVSFINEFDGAYSERSQAIGGSSRSNTSAGTDVQAKSFWTTIQSWISGNAGSFVQSHTSSGGNITDYDGETSISMWAFANLMESVSLGVAGVGEKSFRRATTIPTTWGDWDDAAYSYGIMQAGDIIGPWIFKDLQEAFKRLIWTKRNASWRTDLTSNYGVGYEMTGATWSAAKSSASSNWGLNDNPSSPGASRWGSHDIRGDGRFEAWTGGRKNQLVVTGLWTGKSHHVDFYILPTGISGGFHAQGVTGISTHEDTLYKFNIQSGSGATETSALFGNTSATTWCPEPYQGVDSLGWMTDDKVAIVRWTGFDYV